MNTIVVENEIDIGDVIKIETKNKTEIDSEKEMALEKVAITEATLEKVALEGAALAESKLEEVEAEEKHGFESFNLNPLLLSTLKSISYQQPTPIQRDVIPLFLEGHDIIGSAQTGTGKTAAFGIPLVELLSMEENKRANALILVPTRELALQIRNFLCSIRPKNRFKIACLRGGESKYSQREQLKGSPRIIVGTPGRIIDYIENGMLDFVNTKFAVLDETDKMLEIGFNEQLKIIFAELPVEKQVAIFSATVSKNVEEMSKAYLVNPKKVSLNAHIRVAEKIKQEIIFIPQREKYDELLKQLNKLIGSAVIFVKTKSDSEELALSLHEEGFKVSCIHGDLKQRKRDNTVKKFINGVYNILVATDVFSRGMDVPNIRHVINYDVPFAPEDYIHRIGRTARAGAEGHAICFVSPSEERRWMFVERLMNKGKDPVTGGSERRTGDRFGNKSGNRKNTGFPKNRFRSSNDNDSESGSKRYSPKSTFGENSFGKERNGFGNSEGRSGGSRFRGSEGRFGNSEGRSGSSGFRGSEGRFGSLEGSRFGSSEGRFGRSDDNSRAAGSKEGFGASQNKFGKKRTENFGTERFDKNKKGGNRVTTSPPFGARQSSIGTKSKFGKSGNRSNFKRDSEK